MAAEAAAEVRERGPWTVLMNGNMTYLESSDVRHDVLLRISGRFENRAEEIAYAHEIARRLNAQNPKPDCREPTR